MTMGRQIPLLGTNRRVLTIVSAVVALLVASVWVVGRFSERSLLDEMRRNLGSSLDVHASGLIGDLADFPAALTMLASDPRILRAVVSGDEEAIGSARSRLRRYADLAGVESAMIVRADGRLIVDHDDAPSIATETIDWLKRQQGFDTALTSGLGRAFGRTGDEGTRRYVFVRRMADPGAMPALLVVAVSLDHTELLWRLAGQEILVVDRQGVVMLGTDPRRHFEGLGDASDASGEASTPPYKPCREGAVISPGEQICLAKSIPLLGWDIYLFGDTAPVRDQVRLLQWVTVLGLISLMLLVGVIGQRRLAFRRTLRIKEDANRLLQQRVDMRTGELQAANRQLRIEIDERIAKEQALRDTQAELVQTGKLAALGQLSAGIAHQLNQPLAALRAYADNARTFLARDKIEPARENLTLIGDLTERMGKITRDLKILARRQPTRTEPVSLPPLVRSVIDQIEQGRAADALEIVYDGVPAQVLAEPVGLQQVLVNLIQNGIDSMDTANGPQAKTVTITTAVDGDRVALAVADRGTGIDSAIMDSIFDPFFTTKDVGKGLGLGLSLSASMIKDMGGRLSAANRVDGGACFTIELERADAAGGPA